MKRPLTSLLILLCFLLGTSIDPAWASENGLDKLVNINDPVPINIQAKKLSADKNQARFDEEVVIRRGDTTLLCDHLLATYQEKSQEIKSLRAWGNVRIIRGDQMAKGEEALYERETDEAILGGNPVIYQGPNVIYGEKIIYRFKEATFQVIAPKAQLAAPSTQKDDAQ